MDRAQKQDAIESLKGVFDGAGAVVVTHYMGLTVAEMTDLRGRLRSEGAQLQVVKNTLATKALGGSIGAEGDALFKGPVAVAFASDPVIRKYTGVLAAADVYTASSAFVLLEAIRLDLGVGSQVHP